MQAGCVLNFALNMSLKIVGAKDSHNLLNLLANGKREKDVLVNFENNNCSFLFRPQIFSYDHYIQSEFLGNSFEKYLGRKFPVV